MINRREFLRSTAAVAAVSAVVEPSARRSAEWDEFYERDLIYDLLSELADERADERSPMLGDYERGRDYAKRLRDAALLRAQNS